MRSCIVIKFVLLSIIFFGCSKLQKQIPEPTTPSVVHAKGWMDTTSANFHGNYLKNISWDLKNCVQCHAGDFSGGTSKVSCFGCHDSYPHKTGWNIKDSTLFHGLFIKIKNWDLTGCKKCHGSDFNGGNTMVGCYGCHESYPHKEGWTQKGDTYFHGNYLRSKQWNLPGCKNCHGLDYDGGALNEISCMSANCHIDENQNKKSPEACNTCHGNFSKPAMLVTSWAPPRGLDGNVDSTFRSVGAHQIHLSSGKIGKTLKCNECHVVPTQVFATGHLDNFPAEVVMNDTLAKLITGNGTLIPNPQFNLTNLTCSSTYCHGNWKLRRATSTNQFGYADSIMVGANYSPIWNGGSTQAACGTCHGLPPTGHVSSNLNNCGNCHSGVVNNAGVIIDKTKHINGKINVFGQEKWMN